MRITQLDTPKTDEGPFSYSEVRFTIPDIHRDLQPNVTIGGYGMIISKELIPERAVFLAKSFAMSAITHFQGIPK